MHGQQRPATEDRMALPERPRKGQDDQDDFPVLPAAVCQHQSTGAAEL